jgi:hypothetical protein
MIHMGGYFLYIRAVPELNVWEGRVVASFFFYMGGWFFDK